MERILKRDRILVIMALAALSLLAWVYLAILAKDMAAGDMRLMGMPVVGETMASGAMGAMTASVMPWTLTTFVLMAVMWWVMMVGMMVPSAAPMILLFATLTRKQVKDTNPGLGIALFTSAYLLIWAAFSLGATLAQWALTQAALLSPMMVGTSRWLMIGLLLACGIYQLTPLKQACLGKCRSPLSFLMVKWRPGRLGALEMGLSHGAYCLGCCWLLMALLFIGGVMNLFWVALIAIVVLAEKVLPRGDLFGKAGGVVMIVLAAYMALPRDLFA
jgi:predicted metal-binding membrane protein